MKKSTRNGVPNMNNQPVHILMEHKAKKDVGTVIAITGCKRQIVVIALGNKLPTMARVTADQGKVTCKKCKQQINQRNKAA